MILHSLVTVSVNVALSHTFTLLVCPALSVLVNARSYDPHFCSTVSVGQAFPAPTGCTVTVLVPVLKPSVPQADQVHAEV